MCKKLNKQNVKLNKIASYRVSIRAVINKIKTEINFKTDLKISKKNQQS